MRIWEKHVLSYGYWISIVMHIHLSLPNNVYLPIWCNKRALKFMARISYFVIEFLLVSQTPLPPKVETVNVTCWNAEISRKKNKIISKWKPDRMKFILLCVGMKWLRITVNTFVRKKIKRREGWSKWGKNLTVVETECWEFGHSLFYNLYFYIYFKFL